MQAAYSIVSRFSRLSNDENDNEVDDNERPAQTSTSWLWQFVRRLVIVLLFAVAFGVTIKPLVPRLVRRIWKHHGASPSKSHLRRVAVFTIQSTLSGTLLRTLRSGPLGTAALTRHPAKVYSLAHATNSTADGCYRSMARQHSKPKQQVNNASTTLAASLSSASQHYGPPHGPVLATANITRLGPLRVAMLRSPRAHVFNMYLACRASASLSPRAAAKAAAAAKRARGDHARRTLATLHAKSNASRTPARHEQAAGQLKANSVERSFPGAGATAGGLASTDAALMAGLRKWLGHFEAGVWTAQDGDWQCVHPRSLQTRALTCASSEGGASARHVLTSGR